MASAPPAGKSPGGEDSEDAQSSAPSCASSEPEGWNSDDEPPKDSIGDEMTCCRDGGVKKFIRRPAWSFEQPGQYDIVLIRCRRLPPPKPKTAKGTPEEKTDGPPEPEAEMEELEVPLSEDRLPLAVECAVRRMRLGEVAEVAGPSAYSAIASPLSGRRLRNKAGRIARGAKVPRKLRFMPQAPRHIYKAAQAETTSSNPPPHYRMEVELVRIDRVLVFCDDASVRKELLSLGEGRRTPHNGDLITFSIAPHPDGGVEGERHVDILGKKFIEYPGLEHVLLSMKEGERSLARFFCKEHVSATDDGGSHKQGRADAEEKSELGTQVATTNSEEKPEVRITVTMHYWQHRDTVSVPSATGSLDDACPSLQKFEMRRGPERWNYSIEDGSEVLIALVPCHGNAVTGSNANRILLSWCIGEGAVPKYLEAAVMGMRLLEVAEFRTPLETLAWLPEGPSFAGQTPLRRASIPEVLPLVDALFEIQGDRAGELPSMSVSLPDSWRSAGEPVQWKDLGVEPSAESGADISFRVAMLAGSEPPEVELLEEEGQCEYFEREKARGNALAKSERFVEAAAAYRKALDTVRHTPVYKSLFPTSRGSLKGAISVTETGSEGDALSKLEPEEIASRRKSLSALHLNLALCAGKAGNPVDVRTHTSIVLGGDADNVKALFRRGAAASAFGDYEDALVDLQKALELQPQDKAVRAELQDLRMKMKQHAEVRKVMYGPKAFEPESRVPPEDSEAAKSGAQKGQTQEGESVASQTAVQSSAGSG